MKRPIIFGEILYDCFADGSAVCSGAPLNVCRNLKYLGYAPLMISRVGTDKLGDAAIKELSSIDLDISGIQRDAEHPTSQATVVIVDDEPGYQFTANSAWDNINATATLEAVAEVDAAFIYTGTLALRSPITMTALNALLDAHDTPIFFDANLRDPWWDRKMVNALIHRATWLKCNESEYITLFGESDPESVRLSNKLEVLIITRGADGAEVFLPTGCVAGPPPPLDGPLVDTVGAGDAFASAIIHGILQKSHPQDFLDRALQLSAKVCGLRGADWG
jgi:fructokinase